MVTKRNARALAILMILLLALSVRIAAATKWHRDTLAGGQTLRLGDSDSYWVLAGQIARAQPYQYGSPDASIFRAPVYPMLLAPFTLIDDRSTGIYWARLMGCLMGTWAVYLVMRLTRQLISLVSVKSDANENSALGQECPSYDTNKNPGLGQECPSYARGEANWWPEILAGLLAAIYPGAIGMSIVILSEAVFCPLMLLTILGWQRTFRAAHVREIVGSTFLAGMTSGLAILARPSWLLFMPLASVVILLLTRRRGYHLAVLTILAFGCIVVMAPWWYRNWLLTARWVPTTLQVGASLYDGLHAGASGGSDENMQFVEQFIHAQRSQDSQLGLTAQNQAENLQKHSSFEYRLNASMQRAALDWAGKNISGAIELSLVKFARTWSVWPGAGQMGSSGLKVALTLGCFGILALAAWGSRQLWASAENWQQRVLVGWSLALVWAPTVYFTLLHMVFVGSIRYREPAVLVLSALAGLACMNHQFNLLNFKPGTIRHGSQSIEATSGITSG